MERNSKLILAKNIKLDKEYNNVLNYNTEKMLQLLNDPNHIVATYTDFSFIRSSINTINVPLSYDKCLGANYMAFQNPMYSNKWFFAFIDNIEYVSNQDVKITFTVDVWSTWWSEWHAATCFVEREHVNSDLIGEHTVAEGLETGEYKINEYLKDPTSDNFLSDLCYIMASSCKPEIGEAKDTTASPQVYNGISTGLAYFRYDTPSTLYTVLDSFMAPYGKLNAINGIFMAPKWLAIPDNPTLNNVKQSNKPYEYDVSTPKLHSIDGYTPINNKLFTFPFTYLVASNNVGQNAIYHFEKFSSANCQFKVRGVLNPGCSITLVPKNYNGAALNENEQISLGKYPICNYQNDMYTLWQANNSLNILGRTVTTDDVNVGLSIGNAVGNLASSLKSGDTKGVVNSSVSGFTSVYSSLLQKKQHDMIPPTISGQLNAADVNVASGNNTFQFYKMSIKKEFAEIIDNYFSRYGYAINRMKVPNLYGRKEFNFVKIGSGETIGYGSVPSSYMTIINTAAQKGVTIWHNHESIGNYNILNPIV